MKNQINIAELLKDCPKGMELNCTIYDNVEFKGISDNKDWPIAISVEGYPEVLNPYGCISYRDYTKCVIFPKGKTTWEGFKPPCPFNGGDILYTRSDDESYGYIFIFESITENTHVNSYLHIKGDDLRTNKAWLTNYDDKYLRFATEEEKQKLFDAIKANGYKWNEETKTLEKLIEPKFKVGDRIRLKNGGSLIEVTSVNNDSSICVNGMSWTIKIKQQDNYELVPNKFDITTLKPFDSRVLVRDSAKETWKPNFFGCLCDTDNCPYMVVGGIRWKCCIPYENNEHLLGTTDDCDEFYKTWK